MTASNACKDSNSPDCFEPNGDYIVSNQTASNHDRRSPGTRLFSEAGVWDSAFSSVSIAFGGQARNQGQSIAMQLNGQVVVVAGQRTHHRFNGRLARLDTKGELDTTFGGGGTPTLDKGINGLLIDANGNNCLPSRELATMGLSWHGIWRLTISHVVCWGPARRGLRSPPTGTKLIRYLLEGR